jgi:hypothetical protein
VAKRVKFDVDQLEVSESSDILTDESFSAISDFSFYSKQSLIIPPGSVWRSVAMYQVLSGVLPLGDAKASTAMRLDASAPVYLRVDSESDEFLMNSSVILTGSFPALQFKSSSDVDVDVDLLVWGDGIDVSASNPYYLSAAQSGILVTNQGLSVLGYVILPPLKRGLIYGFEIENAHGIRFYCVGDTTITGFAQTSTLNGYFESYTPGSIIYVTGTATGWLVTSGSGVWTAG